MRVADWVVSAFAVAACAGPPGSVPSAVIQLSPASVCAGDDYRTVIEVDGRQSSTRLTLIPQPPAPGEAPLRYEWHLEGGAVHIVEGDLGADRLVLTADGVRPVHVWLTVTNEAGDTASSQRSIALTLPDFAACTSDDECLEGERCERARCVADSVCADDTQCPACTVCDETRSVCVPREVSP